MKLVPIPQPVMVGVALLGLSSTPCVRAAGSGCEPVVQAMAHMADTSSHQYMTMTAGFNGGKPMESEVVISGNTMYVKAAGRWTRTSMSTQQLKQDMLEKMQSGTHTCIHVRDEAVAGEAASVYEVKENGDTDTQIWISTSRDLPLREDIDIDVGGKLGKSHTTSRFDYSNVQAPAVTG